jgi:hypothetical protein
MPNARYAEEDAAGQDLTRAMELIRWVDRPMALDRAPVNRAPHLPVKLTACPVKRDPHLFISIQSGEIIKWKI